MKLLFVQDLLPTELAQFIEHINTHLIESGELPTGYTFIRSEPVMENGRELRWDDITYGIDPDDFNPILHEMGFVKMHNWITHLGDQSR